nr:MAG TPA: hypothetical protein [Caudoviricetes sp.]
MKRIVKTISYYDERRKKWVKRRIVQEDYWYLKFTEFCTGLFWILCIILIIVLQIV